jgi:hypothetical protein
MAPGYIIALIIAGDNGYSPGSRVGGGGVANSPGSGGGGGGGRAEAWKNGCYYKFFGVITYSFFSIGLGSSSRSDCFFRSESKSLVDEDA